MSRLHIFLADDHAAMREGLKMLINAQPDMEVVGQACDGYEAVRESKACRPDVVVMDVSMPNLDGVAATGRIKEACPEIRVLALTRHHSTAYLRRLLQSGASGYVLKRAAADELIVAIRTVAAGGNYLDPMLAGRVLEGFAGRAKSTNPAQLHVELTEREADVLRLIAWGESNKEIAAQLDISVKTVEHHKARAMEKLSLRSRTEIVRYALAQGWLREDAGPE